MKNIFISSTFRDMQAERDLVQERVLPELRDKARKYGENVGVIDLRWGVDTSELETDEGSRKVLSVCLDEIERSHPYMLIFMGERYGWIPDSKMIGNAVAGKADKLELDDYEKSITALEIEFGALSEKYGELEKCVVCFRSPLAHLIKDEEERKIYLEENTEATEKLHQLQKRMKEKLGDKIIEYTADWNEEEKCFENFMTMQGLALEDAITSAYLAMFEKDWEAYSNLTWQQKEQLEVQAVMESKLKSFRGRERLIGQYRKQLEKNYVLVLRGEVGSGKTSIVCKLIHILEEEGKKVFRFFAGNTINSTRAFDLLKQMVYFLEDVLGVEKRFREDDEEQQTLTYNQWKNQLASLCFRLPKDSEVYFCLDALDQLQKDQHVETLDFLPKNYENIHFLISCTKDFSLNLNFKKEDKCVEEVPLLSMEDALKVIQGLSIANSRSLHRNICEEMLKKKDSGNPLYLNFLVQRLNMMDQEELRDVSEEHEITAICKSIICEMPQDLESAAVYVLEKAIERIVKEENALREILNLVAVSRNGLRKEDLAHILSMQKKVYSELDMTRLMRYLEGFFVLYSDERIDFGHKVIRKGLRKQLLDKKHWQRKILEHLNELPETDEMRNLEGMYFARELQDVVFAYNLFLKVAIGKEDRIYSILEKSIAEEAVADLGEFYGRVIECVTRLDFKVEEIYNLFFDRNQLEKFLDVSKAEMQTMENYYKKLLECCLESYEKEREIYNYKDLANAYDELYCTWMDNGGKLKRDKIDPYTMKASEYREKDSYATGSIRSLECLILICEALGKIYEEQGRYEEAETYYVKALKYSKQADNVSIEKENELANDYFQLGKECESLRLYKEAQDYYKRSEYHSKRYDKYKNPEIEAYRRFKSATELAYCYKNLGDVCAVQEKFEDAQVYYKQAENYCEESEKCYMRYLEYRESDLEAREFLAEINKKHFYLFKGNIYEGQGRYEEAKQCYVNNLEYIESIYKIIGNLEDLQALAEVYHKLGDLCKAQENYKDAEAYYKKFLEYSEQIYEKTRRIDSLQAVANSYKKLGDVWKTRESYDEAKMYYKKFLEYSEQIYRVTESIDSLQDLVLASTELLNVCRAQEFFDEAEYYYEKVQEYNRMIREEMKKNDTQKDFLDNYMQLGWECEDQGNYEEADKYFQKCLEYKEKLYEETKTIKSLKDLSECYWALGHIFKERELYKKAKMYYEKSLECKLQIYEENKSIECLQNAAEDFDWLGLEFTHLRSYKEAEIYYRKSLEYKEQVYEKMKDKNSLSDLANEYYIVGDFWRCRDIYKEAEACYEKALKYLEELRDFDFVAIVCVHIEEICKQQERYTEAKKYHKKARKFYRRDTSVLPWICILWNCLLAISVIMLIMGGKNNHSPMMMIGLCMGVVLLIMWMLIEIYRIWDFKENYKLD